MKRTICFALLVVANSCQLPPERTTVRALPEDTPPLPYVELLTRARLQSSSATENFYLNQWADLEEAGKALSQTARFLNKAIEVPDSKKASLVKEANDLHKAAVLLVTAARDKDVDRSNKALQQINLLVRELRPKE